MMMLTASDAEFERMAELVRRDDPSLARVMLEADGSYQTRTMRFDDLMRDVVACLADGLKRRGSDEFPTFHYAWGKSRVGSTALANLFGVAGLPSFYQPVKAVMRQCLKGEPGVPLVPHDVAQHAHIFAKETAGPYMLAECLIIPFQAMLEAGYPADKLRLIILDREPASSLASWINKLSCRVPEKLLVRHYVLATLNTVRVENYLKRMGVAVTHYVHEASKEPTESARALFARLGLTDRFKTDAVTDWRGMGAELKDAKVVFPTEPKIYDVPGLHASSGTAYRYNKGGALSAENTALIARFGIPEIYRASADACARDLGMSRATADRLFGSELVKGAQAMVAAE
jgi:hypothetical protein